MYFARRNRTVVLHTQYKVVAYCDEVLNLQINPFRRSFDHSSVGVFRKAQSVSLTFKGYKDAHQPQDIADIAALKRPCTDNVVASIQASNLHGLQE